MGAVNAVGTAIRGPGPTRVSAGDAPRVVAGRFTVTGRLGRGGGGDVWLAEDGAARDAGDGAGRRAVALKLVAAREAEARARLAAEFAQLAGLAHPSIVGVRDVGVVHEPGSPWDGAGYLATDLIAGEPLARLAAIAEPERRVVALRRAAWELADALSYLHGRGVLHRDVHPDNVIVTPQGRAVLLDFGLATSGAGHGGVSGRLGFVAPEALLGEPGPLADLFSLGATLYAAWTGVPPFGEGRDAVLRTLEETPPAAGAIRPGLPAALDELITRLLARAPEARPESARELLRALARLDGEGRGEPAALALALEAPEPAGDPLAGVFVGRAAERATLLAAIERLAEGAATTPVLVVAGEPGTGRRSLMELALRDARARAAAGALPAFDWVTGGEALAPIDQARPGEANPEDVTRAAQRRVSQVLDHLERRAAERPVCVSLAPGADARAIAAAAAANPGNGRLLLLVAVDGADPPIDAPFATTLRLEPLADADVAALVRIASGGRASGEATDAVVRAAAGRVGVAIAVVRACLPELRSGAPVAIRAAGAVDERLGRLLEASFAALSSDGQALAAALALGARGRAEARAFAGLGGGDAELRAALAAVGVAGWARVVDAGELVVPSEAHVAVVTRLAGEPGAGAIVGAVARRALEAAGAADPRAARWLACTGDRAAAAAAWARLGRDAAATGQPARAAECFSNALAEDGRGLGPADRIAAAAAFAFVGRYDDGLRALEPASEQIGGAVDLVALAEAKAHLLRRRGDFARAHAALTSAAHAAPAHAGRLRALTARLLVAAGRFADALAELASADGELPEAAEARVLACAYLGRVDEARAALEGMNAEAGRRAFLEGLVAQLSSKPAEAAAAYGRAARDAERAGDVHRAASATLNGALALAELGRYEEALPALERAIRDLGRLGAAADQGLALFNAGLVCLALGDADAAAAAERRVRARAAPGAPFEAWADALAGDLARRSGTPKRALAPYERAAARFAAMGQGQLARALRLARIEALAEAGDVPAAQVALASWAGEPDDEALWLCRARVALACAPDASTAEGAHALAAALARVAEAARAAERRPIAWRAAALAAALAARAGDGAQAASLAQVGRATLEEVRMSSPSRSRAAFDADPDARFLRAVPRDDVGPGDARALEALALRAARSEARLRRYVRINKRLNSELRLSRVLEGVLDTVIELCDAERGFILLKDAAGELAVKLARNLDQRTLDADEFAFSRSIARRVAETGEAVITVDAAGDARFAAAASVSDLRLRSVLAVPLAVKGEVVGTIYVDHRLRQGAFAQDDIELVLEFAEQGAIAIENARLVAELRRRERQVETMSRRLEAELAARRDELKSLQIELGAQREVVAQTIGTTKDHRGIVGRSSRMLEVFRLLDRVGDTQLPVVILGESGTGKELVARAIVASGPRRDKPFVSENCAAVPETLLESTLFGYVKGAFTGADRDTRGLFAIADGGTLFLDEVAEMSPAMQGKLLRVLQEGELRRVGSERPQKVDVRVIAATNRDLPRMVAEGKFRQDLYYRLAVVTVKLPALRERREDIPLLVQHFLAKAAKQGEGAPKAIAPAALAKLCAYRWPGNVRELENELARASAFAAESITVDDLSPAIAAGEGAPVPASDDDLTLRPRLERIERSLIREALDRAGGNQTKAAELLGLSRFGLQKKLKRYRL